MTLKQKLYDLKIRKREAVDAAKAFLMEGGDPESDAYREKAALVTSYDPQISAVEALIAEEEKSFTPAPEGDGSDAGMRQLAAPMAGRQEKTFTGGVLKGLKESSVKTFAEGVRRALKAMTEGASADGGYTVPEDVVNRVYTLIEAEDNMLPYITNTPVTTSSGKRTFKKRAQMTGFTTVAEQAKYPATDQPTFAQIAYTIVKRGGYLPVTLELLEDSDENIASLVIQWLADEGRVTINKKIVELATAGEPEKVSDLDGVLKILTVGLGSALRKISTIHTNDSGLLWLVTLKDGMGRPLLQPDPTQPTRMLLAVGAVTVPIKVWDDATLPNTEGGDIPLVIGSLKEGIQRFDRKMLTITRLTEATVGGINLAEQDMVAFKANMRDDYQLRDEDAFVYATVAADAVKGLSLASAVGAVSLSAAPVPALTGIEITKAPKKTAYAAGEDFDKTGMTVNAHYDDGSVKTVSSSVTVIGGEALAAGTTIVFVSYAEGGVIVTAVQAVTVES